MTKSTKFEDLERYVSWVAGSSTKMRLIKKKNGREYPIVQGAPPLLVESGDILQIPWPCKAKLRHGRKGNGVDRVGTENIEIVETIVEGHDEPVWTDYADSQVDFYYDGEPYIEVIPPEEEESILIRG